MSISRRKFVFGLSTASIMSPFLLASKTAKGTIQRRIAPPINNIFQHGIASGDPLSDRVILWTRISGTKSEPVKVTWEMSEVSDFSSITVYGETWTDSSRDYTVKVDATGLSQNTRYYFRFSAHNTLSAVGKTRTLPVGNLDHLRLAVVSCSNYAEGYFNVYHLIAQRDDIAAVIHLGDYIYESNMGTHGGAPLPGREVLPNKEIVSLDDYRQRHAQYKTDPDLQGVHLRHPFITVWDDHEIANDAWPGGAGNHNPELGEGDWIDRKRAAMQAYFEWMPIREISDTRQIYRSFEFGNLFDLVMLDTRMAGRDDPQSQNTSDTTRTLLGKTQESWLYDTLNYSKQHGTQWRLIGQQVMFGQLMPFGEALNIDQWDGYPESRTRLLETLQSNEINNTVFLTGDIHSSWANELSLDPYDTSFYKPDSSDGSLGVEFVTPAISSKCLDSTAQAIILEQMIYPANPHTKYVELSKRGYMLIDITKARVQVDWHYTDTVTELSDVGYIGKSLQTLSNSNRITEVI